MTREEMRERVAQLFCGGSNPCEACFKDADAAIAIIRGETLEEAARHFDRNILPWHESAAAAIRALKEGK